MPPAGFAYPDRKYRQYLTDSLFGLRVLVLDAGGPSIVTRDDTEGRFVCRFTLEFGRLIAKARKNESAKEGRMQSSRLRNFAPLRLLPVP